VDHSTFVANNAAPARINDTQWNDAAQLSGDKSWTAAPGYGSSQFLFFEDDSFDSTAVSATDAYDGARFVMRHNTFNNLAIPNNHGTESHGRGRGTRAMEIYNNTFIGHGTSNRFVGGSRSGSVLFHDNNISGYAGDSAMFGFSNYRIDYPFAPFAQADGTHIWDVGNTADHTGNGYGGGPNGVFATGTAASTNSSNTVTVTGANWTTNQWVDYIIRRTSNLGNLTTTISEGIMSNTANTITYTQRVGSAFPITPLGFTSGDTLEIRRLVKVLDGVGMGTSDLLQDVFHSVTSTAGSANLTLANHGFGVGTPVIFTGTPPGGFTNTWYYIVSVTTNTFQLASSPTATSIVASSSVSAPAEAVVNTVTGKGSQPNQVSEPCYSWNNVNELGHPVNFAPTLLGYFILEGVHYFNNTQPPFSYTPYTYPHPLVSGSPPAPTNLRIQGP